MVEKIRWDDLDIDEQEFVSLHERDKSIIYRNREVYLEISNDEEEGSPNWSTIQNRVMDVVSVLNKKESKKILTEYEQYE
jgi:hypothetical protein